MSGRAVRAPGAADQAAPWCAGSESTSTCRSRQIVRVCIGRGRLPCAGRRRRPARALAARRAYMPISARRYGSSARCGERSGEASASACSSGLHIDQQGRQRQFGAQRVHFLQVESRMVVDWRASACCMVPALTFGLPSRSPPIQLPICRKGGTAAPHRRHPNCASSRLRYRRTAPAVREEGDAVVGQRVFDFVGHRQLRVAQHAGLPQRGDARLQQFGLAPVRAASAAGRARPAGARCRVRRPGCSCAAPRSDARSAPARSGPLEEAVAPSGPALPARASWSSA